VSRASSIALHASSLVALVACSRGGDTQVVHGTAIDHGRAVFEDPTASPSASNPFSCATCHPPAGAADRVSPGGSLAGAAQRASFWGGARQDLLESINDCRRLFMDAPAPWTTGDEEARATFAYLASLGGDPQPIAFTFIRASPDVAPGDPAVGQGVYGRACATCHGRAHDGAGRLVDFAPRLPDDVNASHATLAPQDRRLVFLRKVREGAFVSAAGSMPPFSREALSDADLGAVLAYLGQ
jgi:thiosulfate dehydrogenase